MSDFDIDKLISDNLTSGSVSDAFRDRLLRESTGALVSSRRFGKRLRAAGLMLTIMLIAMGAFVCGNFRGLHLGATEKVPVPAADENEQMTSVPRELVAWLEAARLFRQLGMEDRMARAVERAGRLLPVDTVIADGQAGQVFAAGCIENQTERVEPMGISGPHPSAESVNHILAQSFGD